MGPIWSGTSTPPAQRVRTPSPHTTPPRQAALRAPSGAEAERPEALERDIRSKRPPALSFLLRMATLRRLGRVISLLALDFAGVALAIFTALVLKEAVHGNVNPGNAVHGTKQFLPFAYLLTALLFARSGLYAARALRPGLTRIVGSLFQVAFVALIFAVVNGEHFSSYYLFYGSLAFAIFYVSSLRAIYERVTASILRAAGYHRRAVLVGRGKHIGDVAHALADASHSPIEVVGFLSPNTLPANGLRPLGSLEDLEKVLATARIDEVIIADPDFPQDDAVELVDQCHRRGVRVRLAPSTMEILIHRAEFVPGQSVPLFELGPPVFEGVDFALKRTFDIVGAIAPAPPPQPAAAVDHARRAALLARPDRLPLSAPRHRTAPISLPEVPHHAHRRRGAPGGPGRAERGLRRAVQDPGGPTTDPGGEGAAPLLT